MYWDLGGGGYLTEDDRGRGHSVRLVHGYLPCGRNEKCIPMNIMSEQTTNPMKLWCKEIHIQVKETITSLRQNKNKCFICYQEPWTNKENEKRDNL